MKNNIGVKWAVLLILFVFSIEHNGEIRSLKKSFKKSAIDFLSKFEDDIYTMILIFIWLISLKNDHVIDFFLYLGTCQCALSPCVVIFLKFCGRSTAQTLRKELNVHHFEVYFMRENNYYSVLNIFLWQIFQNLSTGRVFYVIRVLKWVRMLMIIMLNFPFSNSVILSMW